jgi:hypothetical protein
MIRKSGIRFSEKIMLQAIRDDARGPGGGAAKSSLIPLAAHENLPVAGRFTNKAFTRR